MLILASEALLVEIASFALSVKGEWAEDAGLVRTAGVLHYVGLFLTLVVLFILVLVRFF